MESNMIFLILLSALCHSFYNFLMHKSGGNRLFLLIIFIVAAMLSNFIFLLSNQSIRIHIPSFLVIYLASFFYVLYQIFVSKAYEKGEISRLYPLTVLSPILVPIWASIFLFEKLSVGIIVGILITTIGAIIIKQTSFRLQEFRQLFSKKSAAKGAGFAIMASVMYSIGSVFDKSRIAQFELLPYLSILLTCMAINMLIYTLIFEQKSIAEYKKTKWLQVIIAGIVAYISFYTFRIALQHVPVSIAVPIRTSSIIFALFFGILFLHEKITKNKILGIITIILGIVTINFSI